MYRSIAQRKAARSFTRAQRLVGEGHFDAAAEELTKAIQFTPSVSLYDYRGVVFSLARQITPALKSFQQALLRAGTLDERAQVYFHRSLLYGRENVYEQALSDATQAVMLVPHPTYQEAKTHFETLLHHRDGVGGP